MTGHSDNALFAKEDRIRTIAYAIWEEEGRPEGRAGDHWLLACQRFEAETAGESATASEAAAPGWLQRSEPPAAEPAIVAEAREAVGKMRSSRAA